LNDELLPNEYFEIEYKSGKDGFLKEMLKTYSAFANTNTGIIVNGRWTTYKIKHRQVNFHKKVDSSNKIDTSEKTSDIQDEHSNMVDTSDQKVATRLSRED
jgi:hypothetical protein